MPPLCLNHEPQPISPESEKLKRELKELTDSATEQVLRILPPVGDWHHEPVVRKTQKAVYKCDGQADNTWTRAWLEATDQPTYHPKATHSCAFVLKIDEVKAKDEDEARRVPVIRTTECIKVNSIKTEPTQVNKEPTQVDTLEVSFPSYDKYDYPQRIRFMHDTLDTLKVIKDLPAAA